MSLESVCSVSGPSGRGFVPPGSGPAGPARVVCVWCRLFGLGFASLSRSGNKKKSGEERRGEAFD